MFTIIAQDGSARAGELVTRGGTARTPFFMPVITRGAGDRSIGPQEYHQLGTDPMVCAEVGCQVAIANALIASFSPGTQAIRAQGGLHRWLDARCALFTDSGGYQTSQGLSFIAERRGEEGFAFKARWSGAEMLLTPELSIDLQQTLGSDVAMTLDDMAPYGCDAPTLRASVERTHAWAERALARRSDPQQLVFAIAQGGTDPALRKRSARWMDTLGADGVAIGGIGIIPSSDERLRAVHASVTHLSPSHPRYVMGVGNPADIVRLVGAGIDCFDAAYPSIQAARGWVLTSGGTHRVEQLIQTAQGALDIGCDCSTCRQLPLDQLDVMQRTMPAQACAMVSRHNVHFMMQLMSQLQTAIRQGGFDAFAQAFLQRWHGLEKQPPSVG